MPNWWSHTNAMDGKARFHQSGLQVFPGHFLCRAFNMLSITGAKRAEDYQIASKPKKNINDVSRSITE